MFLTADFLAEGILVNSQGVTSDLTLVTRTGGGDVSGSVHARNNAVDNGIYTDLLRADVSAASGAFTGGGTTTSDPAAKKNSGPVSFGLSDATAGTFTQNITFDMISVNPFGDNTDIADETLQLIGKVYETAVADVMGSVDFGVVHVGDVVEHVIDVSNTAALSGLNDILVSSAFTANGAFTALGDLAGVAAGDTDSSSLKVVLDTSADGQFTGTASVILASHNDELEDFNLGSFDVDLFGQVNNFAEADFGLLDGVGGMTGSGNTFLLDLGVVERWGGGTQTGLSLFNGATGFADLLGGEFDLSGALGGFTFARFDPLSGLGAGDGNIMSLFFDGNVSEGFYSFDILFSGSGSNASGYNDLIAPVTLTVQVYVDQVPAPGALALLGLGLLGVRMRRRTSI